MYEYDPTIHEVRSLEAQWKHDLAHISNKERSRYFYGDFDISTEGQFFTPPILEGIFKC